MGVFDTLLLKKYIRNLQNKKWEVRKKAAKALGQIGDKKAVEPLIEALKGKVREVQYSAAWALGEIGDRKAVLPLMHLFDEVMDDKYENCGRDVAEALGKIGDERAVESLIKALNNYNYIDHASRALGRIGKPAVGPLIKVLKDKKRPGLHDGAIYALGHTQDLRGSELLIQMLKNSLKKFDHRDLSYHHTLARTLGFSGDPRAIEPLIQLYNKWNSIGGGRVGFLDIYEKISSALKKFHERLYGFVTANGDYFASHPDELEKIIKVYNEDSNLL